MTTAPEIVDSRPVEALAVRQVAMLDLLSIVPYYTSELSAALRRNGLEVDIAAITYYLDRGCYERHGLTSASGLLDTVGNFPRLPRFLRQLWKTAEYAVNLANLWLRFRSSPPDIVHVQFLPLMLFGSTFELSFLRSLQRQGARIVYTVHNVVPHESRRGFHSQYCRLYRTVDHLICHDVPARHQLVEEFGLAPTRVSVIPHGPLLGPHKRTSSGAARRRLGLRADECVVLCQGILRPYKGVEFLLGAWQEIQARGIAAKLVIAGAGDAAIERGIREKAAGLNGGGSVHLDLRFLSVSELRDYHTAADVLVYPYSEVTTSGALMTGIGYGKAILASRLPAFEQILTDDENGLLAAYGDVGEWSRQLERLILDASLRNRLAQSLPSTSNWDEIALRTLSCYRSALA